MPENQYQQYQPNQIGTRPKKYGNNKGAKYQNKNGDAPQVIQTKGEQPYSAGIKIKSDGKIKQKS